MASKETAHSTEIEELKRELMEKFNAKMERKEHMILAEQKKIKVWYNYYVVYYVFYTVCVCVFVCVCACVHVCVCVRSTRDCTTAAIQIKGTTWWLYCVHVEFQPNHQINHVSKLDS